jgi:hypothetical protein
MSPTNVELVRSVYQTWERGDFGSAEWADPEIEFIFADGPDPGIWTGLDGMARAQRDFLASWDGWRIEAEVYRVLDEERVLVFARMSGRGRTSGLDLAQMQNRGATLFHLRGANVKRLTLYWDRQLAFTDLGLSPEGDAGDTI